jgi:hypothetical protein
MPAAASDQEPRIFEPIAVGRKLLSIRVIVPGDRLGLDEDGDTGEYFIARHREIARASVDIRITEDVMNATAVDWNIPDRLTVTTALG